MDLLPEKLRILLDICKECWTYFEVHYPWMPRKYKSQLVFTNDGRVWLRLRVLDSDFSRFRVLPSTTKSDKDHPNIDYDVAGRLTLLLDIPMDDLIGATITYEQVLAFCRGEVAYYNAGVK
jgi:hypothetical protein